MDSASTRLDLFSETGSIADSDLRDVDLELAAVTAPAQVIEVSVHQGSRRHLPLMSVRPQPWIM